MPNEHPERAPCCVCTWLQAGKVHAPGMTTERLIVVSFMAGMAEYITAMRENRILVYCQEHGGDIVKYLAVLADTMGRQPGTIAPAVTVAPPPPKPNRQAN